MPRTKSAPWTPTGFPGVNNSGKFGRWAFAEFTEVYAMEADFAAKVEAEFNKMMMSFIATVKEVNAI